MDTDSDTTGAPLGRPDTDWLAETFGLGGRVALVTGGNRGIGYMIAEGLLRAGASVVIAGRDAAACEQARTRLSELGSVKAIPADLSTEAGCLALAVAVAGQHPAVDILVNNAGASWGAPIEDYPEQGWDKVMNVNLKAVFMLTRHMLPLLERNAGPASPSRVINIGSVDGILVPAPETYAYSASKAAVHHLTRVLAGNLAARHILVNAIAPGPFESKMTAVMLEKFGDVILAESPLHRIGLPRDMAAAAVYLASAASSYVTGEVLPVDGGLSTTAGPSGWTEQV